MGAKGSILKEEDEFRVYNLVRKTNNEHTNKRDNFSLSKMKQDPVIKSYGGWRDDSEVKSTDCSSRGPEFNSQQPHGGSQPSVMRSGALF